LRDDEYSKGGRNIDVATFELAAVLQGTIRDLHHQRYSRVTFESHEET